MGGVDFAFSISSSSAREFPVIRQVQLDVPVSIDFPIKDDGALDLERILTIDRYFIMEHMPQGSGQMGLRNSIYPLLLRSVVLEKDNVLQLKAPTLTPVAMGEIAI